MTIKLTRQTKIILLKTVPNAWLEKKQQQNWFLEGSATWHNPKDKFWQADPKNGIYAISLYNDNAKKIMILPNQTVYFLIMSVTPDTMVRFPRDLYVEKGVR